MSDPGQLCERCGLCCDGTLFGRTVVFEDEIPALVQLGFAVSNDGERPVMPQPCTALRRTRCSVYEQRPRTCRNFECMLYKRVRDGEVTPEIALVTVNRAKALREHGTSSLSGYLSRHFLSAPEDIVPTPEFVIEPPEAES